MRTTNRTRRFWTSACLLLLGLSAIIFRADVDRLFPMRGHVTGLGVGKPDHLSLSPSNTLANGSQPSQTRMRKVYDQLPLSFEVNAGQTDSRVMFLSRGNRYTLFLTGNEAVLSLNKRYVARRSLFNAAAFSKSPAPRSSPSAFDAALSLNSLRSSVGESDSNSALHTPAAPAAEAVLHMRLVGVSPSPHGRALAPLPGKSNYFIGNDPKKWRTNVPTFAKVEYQDVYPGVNLVYYGNQGRLEYDFVVAPGADARAIRLDIQGSNKVKVDGHGDLVVEIGEGQVRFHKPVIYQPADSGQLRRSPDTGPKGTHVEGEYVLEANHRVRFEVSPYDASKPLIIDPVLEYSTYLGGSGDETGANGMQNVAVDPAGNAYIAGVTDSSNFPVTARAFRTKLAGGGPNTQCGIAGDAFVTKINAQGNAVVYSTYLGGSSDDCGEGIAVDSSGHVYIAGETLSTDFPVAPGVFQPACKSCSNGLADTFAAKLSSDGSALVYSTYIGGSDWDGVPMVTVDRIGNLYIQGSTSSLDFPTTQGTFQTTCVACANGSLNTYVTKLNPEGTALVYSTYLGGSTLEVCGSQIAVDSEGSLYVDGMAFSADFPTTPGAFQTSLVGGADAFVTKLNPAGTALAYSTLLGGSGIEFVSGLAVDDGGDAYVTGTTSSTDFPTTPGAFQTSYGGGPEDAFVTKINPSGTGLVYSTYLGGTGDDVGAGMALDSDGSAYIGGFTSSTDFPTLKAFQPANAGGYDAFVTELNAAGDALLYSTYLGGSGNESVSGIAFDSRRNVYVQGWTASSDLLAVNPIQPQFGGGTYDALLAKISPLDAPGLGLSRLSVDFPTEAPRTTSSPQTVTVRSVGSQSLVIREILTSPRHFAQTNTCTAPLAPGGSCTISVTYTAEDNGVREGVLVVVANSIPASGRVHLAVSDQAGSALIQDSAQIRVGNAETSGPNLGWKRAILRGEAKCALARCQQPRSH